MGVKRILSKSITSIILVVAGVGRCLISNSFATNVIGEFTPKEVRIAMLVGIDLDGTIIDVIPAFDASAHSLGYSPDWRFYDGGLGRQRMALLHDNAFIGCQGLMKPYEGAVEVLKRWAKWNDLVYITARKSQQGSQMITDYIHNLTRIQLQDFPKGDLIFSDDKAKTCREITVDLMVEDHLDTADKVSRFVHCYLIDRPWNQAKWFINRVATLQEIPVWSE